MRTVSRIVAAVTALALAAAGLLVAAEVVVAAAGHRPWIVPYDRWYSHAREHDWTTPVVRQIAAGLVLLGIVLLLAGLARRKPLALRLRSDAPDTAAHVQRRTFERSLERTAAAVDGVGGSKVRIDDAKVRVVATSNRVDTGGIDAEVRRRVEDRLARAQLEQRPTVEVRVRSRGGR